MPDPADNQILAALPEDEAARLFPQLKLVEFPLGMSVYESGDVQRYIYFPTDSIVSLLYVLKNGASAEIAVVGNEGAIGVALFMGGETTPSSAIVQSAGLRTGCRAVPSRKNSTATARCCICCCVTPSP